MMPLSDPSAWESSHEQPGDGSDRHDWPSVCARYHGKPATCCPTGHKVPHGDALYCTVNILMWGFSVPQPIKDQNL